MKALITSSGGIDSTTCIAYAIDRYGKENVATVSFDYGQRHKIELKCADNIASHYGVKHYVLDLKAIFESSNSPLLAHSDEDILDTTYEDWVKEKKENNESTIAQAYVPYRNGLIYSTAAALALSINPGEHTILLGGQHADDSNEAVYPDCSQEFIDAQMKAIKEGSGGMITIEAPFVAMSKAEVIETGLALNTPYELTHSCYNGTKGGCQHCPTCYDRNAAFEANGLKDPAAF